MVERVAAFAARLEVPMRVITFAVRGRTMYPPTAGFDVEDTLLHSWASQSREALAKLKSDGVVGDDVTLQVVTGNGWDQALDAADWVDGELLAIGTSPQGAIARVFLGSKGTKIVRHSPAAAPARRTRRTSPPESRPGSPTPVVPRRGCTVCRSRASSRTAP